MAKHNELGKQGEEAALKFLLYKGHELLKQHYRFGRAEIDIITKEKGIIIFSEVKTRTSNHYGFPEEYITREKIRLVKEAAEEFMYRNKYDGEVRFDVLSVTKNGETFKVHHIEDAFFHE